MGPVLWVLTSGYLFNIHNQGNISITLKKFLCVPLQLILQPRWLLISFLHWKLVLPLLGFDKNGSCVCAHFVAGVLSRSKRILKLIHISASVSGFLFILRRIPFYEQSTFPLFPCWWTLRLFPVSVFLWIKLLGTLVYESTCRWVFISLSSICRSRIAGSATRTYWTLEKLPEYLPKWWHPLKLPLVREPWLLRTVASTRRSPSLSGSHLSGCVELSYGGFRLHFPNGWRHLCIFFG